MGWQNTNRKTGEVLLHTEKPVWVVHYEATNRHGEHWQAYRAVLPVPKGREPWSNDNRRIGPETGFKSQEEAMNAADGV